MTRVLGIDPGSRKTGWGVVEPYGPRAKAIAFGTLQLGNGALEGRMRKIHDGLAAIIEEHRPQVVAVEDIFYAKFANAAIKLGHARGVVLLVASLNDLRVESYPPALVKRSVAGKGRASKEQVSQIVSAILGLKERPGDDATDALAIGLTHIQAMRATAKNAGFRR